MKVPLRCSYCGAEIRRYPSQIREHNFCSRRCSGAYSSREKNPDGYCYRDFSKNSARMTAMNLELNPKRMRQETRNKLRTARLNTGSGESYAKLYGRHEHRVVAEQMLGRPLMPGEVVHHIDRNKRNNAPENLMVFRSQADHAAWHAAHDKEVTHL